MDRRAANVAGRWVHGYPARVQRVAGKPSAWQLREPVKDEHE